MTSSVRVQFLDEVLPNMSEKSEIVFRRTWKRIEAIEEEIGGTLENGLSKEKYTALLSKLKSNSVVSFNVYKSIVMRYMNWLVANNLIDPQQLEPISQLRFEDVALDDEYSRKFFKDFDMLREAVEDTILIAERADDAQFDTVVAAIYLSWFGVKSEDTCGIEKKDLTHYLSSFQ